MVLTVQTVVKVPVPRCQRCEWC